MDLRLKFLKTFLNVPLRLLDRFLPEPNVTYPQTELFDVVYERMFQAYRLEVAQGVFSERDGRVEDGNFLRVLRVSRKILFRVAEDDRYYREWLGLLAVLCHEEYTDYVKALTLDEIRFWAQCQWGFAPPQLGKSFDEWIMERKELFAGQVFAYYLPNLARKQPAFHK